MKPSEGARIDYPIGDLFETVGLDRRQFLAQLGIAVLTVHCLPSAAFASGNWPRSGGGAADDLIIHSGPGAFSHVHDLLIPKAVIHMPPRSGVELTTTKALLHRHVISLTQKELMTVDDGGTVIQRASSHAFIIALTRPPLPPTK